MTGRAAKPLEVGPDADIYLFSTTDLASGRHDALHRMVRSVAQARDERPARVIRLLLLLQNAADHPAPDLPDWVEVHAVPRLVPLSTARNILLQRVDLPCDPATASVVAFPDDDAWYPAKSLHFMTDLIALDAAVDFAVCRSGTAAHSPKIDTRDRRMRLQQAISHGSSNTIFVRAGLASRLGLFDEQLGLGTPAVAGEDTDYAIRAWHDARRARFINAALIGHRDNDPRLKRRYFDGALQAIRKHRSRSFAARVAFIRKRLIGLRLRLR